MSETWTKSYYGESYDGLPWRIDGKDGFVAEFYDEASCDLVIANHDTVARLREARNHWLNAWFGEVLWQCEQDPLFAEDLRPSLSKLLAALDAQEGAR